MEIFNQCPACGYDKVTASNGMQIAIRKCDACGKVHCQECSVAKHMTAYKCPYCDASSIKPHGVIRKS